MDPSEFIQIAVLAEYESTLKSTELTQILNKIMQIWKFKEWIEPEFIPLVIETHVKPALIDKKDGECAWKNGW